MPFLHKSIIFVYNNLQKSIYHKVQQWTTMTTIAHFGQLLSPYSTKASCWKRIGHKADETRITHTHTNGLMLKRRGEGGREGERLTSKQQVDRTKLICIRNYRQLLGKYLLFETRRLFIGRFSRQGIIVIDYSCLSLVGSPILGVLS